MLGRYALIVTASHEHLSSLYLTSVKLKKATKNVTFHTFPGSSIIFAL